MKYRIITDGEHYCIQGWVWFFPFWRHIGYDYTGSIQYNDIEVPRSYIKRWNSDAEKLKLKNERTWIVVK
jgi:hypothetical protein